MYRTPRITLYSSTNCAFCERAREFLRRNRLPFRDASVDTSRRAFSEFQRLGARGVPLLLIGEHRLEGFDPRRLTALLQKIGIQLK